MAETTVKNSVPPAKFRTRYWGLATIVVGLIGLAHQIWPDEFNWGAGDFILFAVMLAVLGVVMELVIQTAPNSPIRLVGIVLALGCFVLIWAGLAVG